MMTKYMNKTRTLGIVAVLTAATLVIAVTFATTTPSAFAKHDGNTDTIQKNKQKAAQSGFDNDLEQEATNSVCTHPDSTCISSD
jgi:hypothetical protein